MGIEPTTDWSRGKFASKSIYFSFQLSPYLALNTFWGGNVHARQLAATGLFTLWSVVPTCRVICTHVSVGQVTKKFLQIWVIVITLSIGHRAKYQCTLHHPDMSWLNRHVNLCCVVSFSHCPLNYLGKTSHHIWKFFELPNEVRPRFIITQCTAIKNWSNLVWDC